MIPEIALKDLPLTYYLMSSFNKQSLNLPCTTKHLNIKSIYFHFLLT